MKLAIRNQHVVPRRLSKLYIVALSCVAIVALLGQFLIQFSLFQQSGDANVINIAGRQRMLSQRICKAALTLLITTDSTARSGRIEEIRNTLSLWERSHQGLQHGDTQLALAGNNSDTVNRLFAAIQPNFQAMSEATSNLLKQVDREQAIGTTTKNADITPFIQTTLAQEQSFLTGMDAIVNQYQSEAQDRVSSLKVMELALLVLMLIVLLLEGLLVFRPAIHKLSESLTELVQAEKEVAARTEELERKNNDLELAFQEAMSAHRKVMPHARVLTYGHYQVQGSQGNYYTVKYQELNGNQLLACECLMYQRNLICSHSLAAAALHSALLRSQQQHYPSNKHFPRSAASASE